MTDWTKERTQAELVAFELPALSVDTAASKDAWMRELYPSALRALAAAQEEIARLRHIQAVADAQTSANADAVEEIARLKAEWNLATAEVQAIAARAVQEATRLQDENTVLDHALAAACRMLARDRDYRRERAELRHEDERAVAHQIPVNNKGADMSAIDILRRFAETHCADDEIVQNGISYRACREVVADFARLRAAVEAAEPLYYMQDTRQYVGNALLWWANGSNGYTCDPRKAQAYTQEEAAAIHRNRKTDLPWPKDYIDARTTVGVDRQDVSRMDVSDPPAATAALKAEVAATVALANDPDCAGQVEPPAETTKDKETR